MIASDSAITMQEATELHLRATKSVLVFAAISRILQSRCAAA